MSTSRRAISLATAVLAAAAVTTITATTAVGATTAPAPSPWPQADANAAANRTNATESTLTPSTVNNLHYLRSITAAPPNGVEGVCVNAFDAPVIAGGSVFVGNINDGAGNSLDRYDLATGQLQWRAIIGFVPRRISVAHGKVVVGSQDCGSVSDPNGFLAAYDTKSGQQLWSSTTSPDNAGFQDLVISGPYVVVSSGSADSGSPELTVHRLSDGSIVWNRLTYNQCDYNVFVVHGEIIVADCATAPNPKISAYAIGTGNLTWSKPGYWQVQRGDSDTSSGHHLFATKPNGVIADLDPTTGHGTGPLTGATAVVAVGLKRAYATCANDRLCAFRLSDHSQAWTSSTGIKAQVAVADGLIYTDYGDVVDGATGQHIRWVDQVGSDGNVIALEVGYGRLLVQQNSRVLDIYGLDGE